MNPFRLPAIERRTLAHAGTIEIRQRDGRPRIIGLAAPFGTISRNLGGFVETVGVTAFNESRSRGWPSVLARYNHDPMMLLGTSHTEGRPAPTLELAITSRGLEFDVLPPLTRNDVVELVERGDVRHSSFAFRTLDARWGTTAQGYPLRTLVSVELIDVAPVSNPAAYRDATAALRSLALAADRDLSEVRALAAEDNLRVLWGRSPRPQRAPHTSARLLGAAARQRLEQLAADRPPWGRG